MTKEDDDAKPNGRADDDEFGEDLGELDDDTAPIFLIDGCLTHLRGLLATGGSLTVNFHRLSDLGKRNVLTRAAGLFREAGDAFHDAGRLAEHMIRQMHIREDRKGRKQ
jgi:hypothetical protein